MNARVRVFDLCDTCAIRNGLLTVVNGSINLVRRDEYPAVLGCDIALTLEVDVPEAGYDFDVRLQLIEEADGTTVDTMRLGGRMEFDEVGGITPTAVVSQRIDANDLPIPRAGSYRLVLTVAGEVLSYLTVEAQGESADSTEGAKFEGSSA